MSCYMRESAGLLLIMLKYFGVMLTIIESWLVYANKFSGTIQSCSLTETIKYSQCQLLFLTFSNSYKRKINFSLV